MRVIDLGITDFLEAYSIQMDMVRGVSSGGREDTLLITEHKPVITIGRKGSRGNILRSIGDLASLGIDVLDVDRGGDVTFHAPGQIVAYPVFKLKNEARDIHNFLDFLEEVASFFLAQYGIFSSKRPGLRGVWVEDRKIASIGIGVKKWVTYHGLAININLDPGIFTYIKPCGIEGVKMTSLKKELGKEPDIYEAKDRLVSAFKEIPLLAETAA